MDKEKITKEIKENKEKSVYGVFGIIIVCLVIMLTWSLKTKETMVKFSSEDIEIISQMQETYKDDITVYKDKNGKLVIKWD